MASYTPFLNPVLEYLWSFINMIIGIAIIYEIVKLIDSLFKPIGSGEGSVAGNLIDVSRNEKELKDLTRRENQDINKIKHMDDVVANRIDLALRATGELHEKIMAMIGYLRKLVSHVQAGTINKDELIKCIEKVEKKIKEEEKILETNLGKVDWAYDLVSQQLLIGKELMDLIREQSNVVADLHKDIVALNSKVTVASDKDKLANLDAETTRLGNETRKHYSALEKMTKESQDKATAAYRSLANIRHEMAYLKGEMSATSGLVAGKDHITALQRMISFLEKFLKFLVTDQNFLSVFYTMTRDQKNSLSGQMNRDLGRISTDLSGITRDIKALKRLHNIK